MSKKVVKQFNEALSSQEKRDLLAQMYVSYAQAQKPKTAPTTFAQERIWQLNQMKPEEPTYNITRAYNLSGPLNVAVLEQGFNQVIRRHSVFRTTFVVEEDRPVQVIAPEVTLKVVIQDIGDVPAAEREEQIRVWVMGEKQQPFDLSHGPLLRVRLLRLGETEHVLILTTHRIIFDGQCWPVLISELSTFCESASQGRVVSLPRLPLQYGEYAVWQRQGQVDEQNRQLTYWQKQLKGKLPLLQLPLDYPRSAAPSPSEIQKFSLPISLSEQIRSLSQRQGVSLFVTLLATFQMLLYRHSGQEDFLIFSSVAGRNRTELKHLIGLFANILALRANLSADPGFYQLLGRVRETVADAFANQDVPFEQIMETFQVERDQSYTPLFQVMFTFWPEPPPPPKWTGMSLTALDISVNSAELDLHLHLIDTKPEITGTLRYKANLFKAATIRKLLAQFQNLLAEVVAMPERPLSSLPFFQVQAEQGLVSGAVPLLPSQWSYLRTPELWVNMVEVIALDQPLNPIWLEQAIQCILVQHDALRTVFTYQKEGKWEQFIQVAVETVPFTYNDFSHHLPVTERTVAMQTSLATMQSSLGPLKDSLMQVSYFDLGLEQVGYLVLTIHHIIADNGSLPILLEDLYQAYQQLSQGQPVCLPAKTTSVKTWSGQLHKYLQSDAFRRQLKSELAVAQGRKTTLPIDYPEGRNNNTLGSTAKVKVALSVEETEALLKEFPRFYNIPLLNALLTAMVQAVAHWSEAEDVTLEMVDTGRYLDLPDAQNMDLSRTVGCLFVPNILVLERPKSDDPIQAIQLVSEQLERLPMFGLTIGLAHQTGYHREEAVGGIPAIELRLNYLGQTSLPDLPGWSPQTSTAVEDFVSNRRHAGIDRNPLLLNCAAIITGGQLLLSWEYSQNVHRQTTIEQIAKEVLEALQAMVSRHRQIRQEKGDSVSEKVFVAPRTSSEEILAAIWAKVFGLERVGVNDNFYELGGDSLLALRIISQAKQSGLSFTPQQFFQNQTIAELVKVKTSHLLEVEHTMIGEIPLTGPQKWFFESITYKGGWDIVLSFAVPLALLPNPTIMEQVVQHIWVYHDQLRANFVYENAGWRQFIIDPSETAVPFYYINLSELEAMSYETAIKTASDALQIYADLAVAPLFRVMLFYLGEHLPLRLVVIVHHLLADSFSISILMEDIMTVHGQVLSGQPIQLPPKPISSKQWVKHLMDYTQSPQMYQEMTDYWLKLPWERIGPLRVDYPENQGRCVMELGDTVVVSLSVEETKVLQKELPRLYNTGILEALIMAALQAVTQWTGYPYQLINIISTGRGDTLANDRDVDLSRTICWTTFNRLLMLGRIESNRPEEILLAVLEQLRHIPNKGFGFDLLHRYGNEEIEQKIKHLYPYEKEVVQILYHGDVDKQATSNPGLIQPLSEPSPSLYDLKGKDYHLPLSLNGQISHNRLEISWEYNRGLFKRTSVEGIARTFIETLQLLVAQVSSIQLEMCSGQEHSEQ